MSVVHSSRGALPPASPALRSEVAIVCGLARRVLGPGDPTPWEALAADYAAVRDRIYRVVPGFEDFEQRVARPGGFVLPHPPRDDSASRQPRGRHCSPRTRSRSSRCRPDGSCSRPSARTTSSTRRSTAWTTATAASTVAGASCSSMPTTCWNSASPTASVVDVVSEWADGDRRAPGFRVVAYPTARGCAAGYFPEMNVLVPLDHTAEVSGTPASKSVVIRLEPTGWSSGRS